MAYICLILVSFDRQPGLLSFPVSYPPLQYRKNGPVWQFTDSAQQAGTATLLQWLAPNFLFLEVRWMESF